VFLVAESALSDVSKKIPGFGGMRKFDRDFHPSDRSYVMRRAAADMQSMTDESIDQPQSDCDQLLSEYPSEAEGSDAGGEKLSQHKPPKPKNDSNTTTSTDRER